MQRIIITGASGFIGEYLCRYLCHEGFKVIGTWYQHNIIPEACEKVHLSLTERDRIQAVIEQYRPDAIIHLAGLRHQECQQSPERAYVINVEGTRWIAELCAQQGIILYFASSDWVFDGGRGMYAEQDIPGPGTLYGITKLEGEKIVLDLCRQYATIFRLSGAYGYYSSKRNVVSWALDHLHRGKTIQAYADTCNSPTYLGDLVRVLQRLLLDPKPGLFHISGSERVSRYQQLQTLCRIFDLPQTLVQPVSSTQNANADSRPSDASLDARYSETVLNEQFSRVAEGLQQMRDKGMGVPFEGS